MLFSILILISCVLQEVNFNMMDVGRDGLLKSVEQLILEIFIPALRITDYGWIGLGDIMRGADDIRSLTATAFQSLFAAAILYLVITTVFSNLMFRLEKKISKEEN